MHCQFLRRWAFIVAPAVPVVMLAGRVNAQQLFHSMGCGSGCQSEYFTVRGPYTDDDGLRKVLVRNVLTQYDEKSNPRIWKNKQVWILADCKRSMINLSSYSSNGKASHSDASGWLSTSRDRILTNSDHGVHELYLKLCN